MALELGGSLWFLAEESQQPSREASGVTKKETVPCSSAPSCDGLHRAMREITVSPSPISSDVGVAALTDRSVHMFFRLLWRHVCGVGTLLGAWGALAVGMPQLGDSEHPPANIHLVLGTWCYYSLSSTGITPVPVLIPGWQHCWLMSNLKSDC